MWKKVINLSILGLVFLMPLFWLPFTFEVLEFNKIYLLFALTAIGIIAWIGKMVFKDKELKIKTTSLDILILLFLGVVGFSSFFSKDQIISVLGNYGRFWPSLLGTFSLGGFYFLFINNVRIEKKENSDEVGSKAIVNTFLVSTFLATIFSYLSIFGIWQKVAELGVKLPKLMTLKGFNSVSGNLEALSMFLGIISAFLVIGLAFKDNFFSKLWSKTLAYLTLFANLGLLLIFDFSSTWLVLVIGLSLFLIFAFWKRIFKKDVNRLSIAVFFLVISLIFLFFNPLSGLLRGTSLGRIQPEVRVNHRASWNLALESVKDNPALGAGLGNFSYVYSKYKPASILKTNFWQANFDRAGNYLADLTATTGILGILAYLSLLSIFIFISYLVIQKRIKEKSKLINHKTLPFLFITLVLFVAQILFYQNSILAFTFWMFLGLTVVSWKGNLKEKEFKFDNFPEVGLILNVFFWLIIAGLVFCSFNLGKYYLADMHYRTYLENPNQNISELENAVSFGNRRATYYVALSQAYLGKAIQEVNQETPDQEEIRNLVRKSINAGKIAEQLAPNRASVKKNIGVIYREIEGMAQGALDWSIKSFEQALQLEPRNPAILTEIGRLKLRQDKLDEARSYFEQAVGVRDNYVEAQLRLADLEEQNGETDKAIERLKGLADRAPNLLEPHFQLGRLYYNNGELDKATEQFLTSITINPNHSNSLYSLGLVYEKQGEIDRALQLFQKVSELNPGNNDVQIKINNLQAPQIEEEATSTTTTTEE